jgi:DNA repair photolyase
MPGRFAHLVSEPVDDGWFNPEAQAESAGKPATRLYPDLTRRLLTTNKSPDIPFDQSINPYKGCEHGCVYCYARPTHAYLDLSPGLDFETKIFYKTDPAGHLRRELSHKNYRCKTIAMGTNTDPYQPAEKDKRVMREILEVLAECHHPISIVTKGSLIVRDLDLLAPMAAQGLVNVHLSITTLDNALKTILEPRAASPAARLRTVRELTAAGVPTGVMLAPVIPFINDHEIEDIVAASADAGARAINYVLLRLPDEVKPLFEEWLHLHVPLKAARVMSAVRDTRGGKAYSSQWHTRMTGEGPIAKLIANRFNTAKARAGLAHSALAASRTDRFQPPASPDKLQLNLF